MCSMEATNSALSDVGNEALTAGCETTLPSSGGEPPSMALFSGTAQVPPPISTYPLIGAVGRWQVARMPNC